MPRPQRSCRICRKKTVKTDLTRWVRQPEGWTQDTAQRLPGRGVYTCSSNCAARLVKKKP